MHLKVKQGFRTSFLLGGKTTSAAQISLIFFSCTSTFSSIGFIVSLIFSKSSITVYNFSHLLFHFFIFHIKQFFNCIIYYCHCFLYSSHTLPLIRLCLLFYSKEHTWYCYTYCKSCSMSFFLYIKKSLQNLRTFTY